MTKQITRTAIILDRSSSMDSMRGEAIGAFNDQLRVIQDEEDEGAKNYVTLVTFATFVDAPLFQNASSKSIPELTEDRYKPSGCTAMLDAVGNALDILEASPDVNDENTSFLVVIISDGEENSSNKWNWSTISERVKKLQATDRWTFVYLGANQDLSEVSKNMSIPYANTMAFTAGPTGPQGPSGLTGATGPTGLHTKGLYGYFKARKDGSSNSTNFYGK